ncbi:hypothetical protein GN958_ATG14061 [Phytophthora infestans]|uniref:Uncharacterized protein n=1 Tax=Phytophthora infestans TaxID=4787 RepID=A0A8S9U799_PHYIN|nr:hypothetical protein GN958_ATG14061 [Phytophthora infestans]
MLESIKRFEVIVTGGEAPYVSQASVWPQHLSELDPLSQISGIHDTGVEGSADTHVPPTAIDEDAAHRKDNRPKQHEADRETSNLSFTKDLTSARSHTGDVALTSSHTDDVTLCPGHKPDKTDMTQATPPVKRAPS